MIRTAITASLAALTLGAASQAQDFTLSAGYEAADFDAVEFDTAVFRGSYFFNENFGLEGQLGFGLGDETVDVLGNDVNVELDYTFGAYGVYRYAASDSVNLLARAGYVHAEVEADFAGFEASEDDGAFAAGVAAEWFLDDANGVRFDYTWADYDDSTQFYGVSYVRRFGG
ncbi:porin family protein [Maricaulis sp.]|uniref:porin family protein n=1 Tax=Maricaulis sp. TaxID=1486257 RepID=UPI00261C96B8|nr:porin family protein [Maricaulis sp.]